MREQIQWQQQPYSHNQACLDLTAAKPHGILRILDDQCSFPQVGRCVRACVCLFQINLVETTKFNQPGESARSGARASCGKSFKIFRRSCKLRRKALQTISGD